MASFGFHDVGRGERFVTLRPMNTPTQGRAATRAYLGRHAASQAIISAERDDVQVSLPRTPRGPPVTDRPIRASGRRELGVSMEMHTT